jgi:hypothetical protein
MRLKTMAATIAIDGETEMETAMERMETAVER